MTHIQTYVHTCSMFLITAKNNQLIKFKGLPKIIFSSLLLCIDKHCVCWLAAPIAKLLNVFCESVGKYFDNCEVELGQQTNKSRI